MIFDSLNNLKRYRGLHQAIDLAFDYLEKHDLSHLENEEYQLIDKRIFYSIQENQLNQQPSEAFEFHHNYLDLHLILEGTEVIQFGYGVDEVTQTYDELKDIGFATCQSACYFKLSAGHFAIFFPGELHQPNLYGQDGEQVRKCVFKVLIDEEK